MLKQVLTESEAAEYIGMSKSFLRQARYRDDNSGPRYLKIGRSVRYKLVDLDEWLARF